MKHLLLDGVPVCTSSLTQRSYAAAACEFLLPVTSANRGEAIAEFKRTGALGKYSGLRVSGIADLSFLTDFPKLLYLEIVDQKRVPTKHLESLDNLRGLRIESPGTGIDFAWFPHLEVFVGDWHPDNRNLHRARELRSVHTWQFKPASADLAPLTHITRLEQLTLTQTTVASLAGIETLLDLRYLEISHASKLESLEAFAAPELGIRELRLAKAKNIDSYEPIAAIRRLRRLKIFECAPMPHLKWTKGMDDLDFFSFVETNVADGDLNPLLELPKLRYVGTMDKKHYNYKMNRLNEMLQQRFAD